MYNIIYTYEHTLVDSNINPDKWYFKYIHYMTLHKLHEECRDLGHKIMTYTHCKQ